MPEFAGLTSCPYCGDALPKRKGDSGQFYCPSCGKSFRSSGDTILYH
jgi:tRNA(Ile2) C34 agmatinyltransferase TiaS